jgi:Calcineurin-like phosphoesterase
VPSHRIALFSDIHYPNVITKWEPWIPQADLDVEAIVLAGDIHGTPDHLRDMLQNIRDTQRPETTLVVVPGNGDFLGQELEESRAGYRTAVASIDNAVFVDDAVYTLPSGVRIIGSVLWDEPTAEEGRKIMKMFEDAGFTGVDGIRIEGKPLTLNETIGFHRHARAFIEDELRKLSHEQRRATIVCTHFWPRLAASRAVLPFEEAELIGDDADRLYMDEFIKEHGPRFWFVGHIHECVDFAVGNTRVICNARLGEKIVHDDPNVVEYGTSPHFDDAFVIEFNDAH